MEILLDHGAAPACHEYNLALSDASAARRFRVGRDGMAPMRHSSTMGEPTHWFVGQFGLDLNYRIVPMDG